MALPGVDVAEEGVESGDRVAIAHQPLRGVVPDEAGASGDEDVRQTRDLRTEEPVQPVG
jgi:hypothetical protein